MKTISQLELFLKDFFEREGFRVTQGAGVFFVDLSQAVDDSDEFLTVMEFSVSRLAAELERELGA